MREKRVRNNKEENVHRGDEHGPGPLLGDLVERKLHHENEKPGEADPEVLLPESEPALQENEFRQVFPADLLHEEPTV